VVKLSRWSVLFSVLFLGILATTYCIYIPGLDGVFTVDDVVNLKTMSKGGGVTSFDLLLDFVFGNQSGMLGRPLSMLSFLIDDQYFPGDVEKYRYTNLLIHCLCGVMLFAFTRRFLFLVCASKGERYATEVAGIAAALWLLAPLHVSTTLYVVQRMTQLSALFCISGLYVFIVARQHILEGNNLGKIGIFVGLYVFGALSVLSKENGALIFCFALVLELTAAYSRKERSDPFVLTAIFLPLVLGGGYFIYNWAYFTGPTGRDFSAIERLLTEARILWDYLAKIIFPAAGKMGLIHDDIVISKNLISPLSTLVAIVAHLALTISAIVMRKRWPLFFFSVFGFYAGHLLESTLIPLELYFEHRNYLPSIFVFIGLASLCWAPLFGGKILKFGLVLLVLVSILITSQRAVIWGNPVAQSHIWAMEHPNSFRAQTMQVVSLLSQKKIQEASLVLLRAREKWPESVSLDLLLLNQICRKNISLKFSTEEFLQRVEQGKYDGFVLNVFENTHNLYSSKECAQIDSVMLEGFFKRIYQVKMAPSLALSSVAMKEFDFYGAIGNLDLAIRALDKAYGYEKNNFILYLKGAVLFNAGINDDALEFIELAIKQETKKPAFLQRNVSDYYSFRENIKAAMKEKPSQGGGKE